ncbi:MAG: hypothetical protein ACXVA9_10025 [Bdellovibrionales bacterium]
MSQFLFAVMIWPLAVFAQEPGYLTNDSPLPAAPRVEKSAPEQTTPPVRPTPSQAPRKSNQPLLTDQFAHARGLKTYEIQTIHYNRIACDRRIFSPSGQSIEGDGDLKAVNVPPDFIEVEFPSHVGFESFNAENPFQNGVSDLETTTSRQLVNVREWVDGRPLILNKRVRVRYSDDKTPPQTVMAVDEIKVKDGTYPSTYIVRETIQTEPKFNLYFICQ